MNKFKLMAIAFVLGTASLFASTVINPNVSSDKVRSQMAELVQASADKIDAEISVNITFSFNTEGEIVVLKVVSPDKNVLNFVRENINGKKIENPGRVRKEYEMFITVK